MIYVPKKVVERLSGSVGRFQKVLQSAKDRDINEADTVSIVTDILSEVFGFDKYLEVTGEFAIRNTYCDLAIKIADKVQYLIEVKAIGLDLKEHHIRQAISYGASQGVNWVALTNGINWEIYRINFEKPVSHERVYSFNFLEISPKKIDDQEKLFLICKEGISKEFREEYYERVQSVNRFVVSSFVLSDVVVNTIKRELKKFSPGLRIENEEIEQILKAEIIKRDNLEGDAAAKAIVKVKKFYAKQAQKPKTEKAKTVETSINSQSEPEAISATA